MKIVVLIINIICGILILYYVYYLLVNHLSETDFNNYLEQHCFIVIKV